MIGRSENTCVAAVLMLCLTGPLTSPQTALGQDVTEPLYESRFVEANGIRLQYMDFGGSGLPLIFVQDIHNYFEYEELFSVRDLESAFYARFTDDHHVLATVKRGYGESDDPGWGYDVATHSEDLLGLMDALSIHRAVLVGRAPATQDLTWIAEHHPERVAGLVYLGNPVVIRSSQHPEARLFDENYARGACDLEERGIALVGARTSWRPHFLDDETVRIDVPSLRFTHPVDNRRSMDLRRLDRLDAIAAWEPECPGFAQSLEYFRALAADPARRAALREALEASDLSVPIDEGIERAFGASMRTVVEPDWDLPEFHDFIEPHLRRFLEEVDAAAAPSDTVRVSAPTGDTSTDRTSIQAAFDAVQPGGTVLFAPGTYLLGAGARLTVPDVTVLGHPEGTVLRGCDPDAFAVEYSEVDSVVFGCTGLYVEAERQTIRGLTFEYTWHGIVVGPFPVSAEEAAALGESGEQLTLYPAGGQRIEGNTFRNTPNGLRVLGTGNERSVVRDNDFIDVFHAIGIYGAPLHFLDNRVTVAEPGGVPFSRHPGSAIIVSPGHTDCAGHVVAGNRIEGYPDPIYVLVRRGETCRGVEIRDNTIHAARVKVPEAWDDYTPTDDDSTMVGTPITLMNRTELALGRSEAEMEGVLEDIVVQGNQIVGAEGLGILIQGVSRSRIAENRITGIERRDPFPGITWDGFEQQWEVANGSAIWVSPGSNENEIRGNTFEDIASDAVVLEGDHNVVEILSSGDGVRDLGSDNRVTRSDSAQTRIIEVDGHAVHVYTSGWEHLERGQPVVVFEAGGFSTLESWGDLPARLARETAVVAYDRAGRGRSEWDGQRPTLEHVTSRLRRILEVLDAPPPYIHVGHSIGGPLGLTFARQFPDEVAGLVLVDPMPPTAEVQLRQAMAAEGISAIDPTYDALRSRYPDGHFEEHRLELLGRELLGFGRLEAAIAVFELNAREYPKVVRPHESLGDAYRAAGRLDDARGSYQRASQLAEASASARLPALRRKLERVEREEQRSRTDSSQDNNRR